jgi:flagellar M-ring protein FliF
MAGLKDLPASLAKSLKKFSGPQITVGVIGVVAIAILASILVSGLTKPQMAPLFSGISASDASAITTQLKTAGVSYELTNGGTTILVPEAQVDAQRIAAAAAGLPKETTAGYSILDGLSSTSTDFQQTTSYKRAIEGELQKSIAAIEGVTTDSVQLAIPADTVFVSQKADPTASVFVKTRPGVTLTQNQVNAIVHLVSASVQGMKAANVSVIDSSGLVLSAPGMGVNGTGSDGSMKLSDQTKSAVQNILDRVLGPGRSMVAVDTTISNESANITTETFETPKNNPALSESSTSETYGPGGAGNGNSATGVLGPDNIAVPNSSATTAPNTSGTGASGSTGYLNQTGSKINGINKVTEQRSVPAGAVQRKTISVAVDRNTAKNITATDIADLVNGAAGVDTARGDVVNVRFVPFDTSAAKDAKSALAAADKATADASFQELLKQSITGGLIALVVIVLAAFLLLRRKRKVVEEIPSEIYQPIAPVFDYTAPTPAEFDEVDPLSSIRFSNAEPSSAEMLLAEVTDASKRHPEKVAEQLRQMMKAKGGSVR